MGSRGMDLEKSAELANKSYRKNKSALIMKVPTPFKITGQGVIPQKSTVDFTGVIQGGTFIAFDAKETLNKTSFPLNDIQQHQVLYLDYVYQLGGISFFLIHFKEKYIDQAFVTPFTFVKKYWDEAEGGGRKSIPFADFNENWLVKSEEYLDKVIDILNELKIE